MFVLARKQVMSLKILPHCSKDIGHDRYIFYNSAAKLLTLMSLDSLQSHVTLSKILIVVSSQAVGDKICEQPVDGSVFSQGTV